MSINRNIRATVELLIKQANGHHEVAKLSEIGRLCQTLAGHYITRIETKLKCWSAQQ